MMLEVLLCMTLRHYDMVVFGKDVVSMRWCYLDDIVRSTSLLSTMFEAHVYSAPRFGGALAGEVPCQ